MLQALHAVANFKSSDDVSQAPPYLPPKQDPLRALTERGHESVYNKGPASASESNDEIATAPAPLDRLEGLGPLQREKGSMGSLKRASVDVDLLAARSPMGKETMLTFSNTLPRATMKVDGVIGSNEGPKGPEGPEEPVQPVQRRLKAVHVPVDPLRTQHLVSEWKQKSMEMRGLSGEDDSENRAGIHQGPLYPSAGQSGRSNRNPTPPPGVAKAVATPRPPQIPEAEPPPVSPKSALTRAKWLAIREKTSGDGSTRSATGQPRLLQVIAMSKQQGLLASSSSETASTCSASSSEAQREGPGIVTVDAHAPHHPVVQVPLPPQVPSLASNGNSWEWAVPSDGNDAYELNKLQQGDSLSRNSSFYPRRAASPRTASEVEATAIRRKTALILLDREIQNQSEQENYYKSLQGGRFKD